MSLLHQRRCSGRLPRRRRAALSFRSIGRQALLLMHRLPLHGVVSPDVVESEDVVDVGVGEVDAGGGWLRRRGPHARLGCEHGVQALEVGHVRYSNPRNIRANPIREFEEFEKEGQPVR